LIVGWFTVKRILSGPPMTIWKLCNHASGVDEKYFFAYCGNKELIYAIEIEKVFEFNLPIKPHELDPSFKAPQNFMFLDSANEITKVLSFNKKQKNDSKLKQLQNISVINKR
jgi:predicted transcriptional regulator